MSVETEPVTQSAAPLEGGATAPTISPTPPPAPAASEAQAEVPAIRVGNSGAHIARASREIEQQLRAAEAGQQPDPAGSESADPPSGATVGGQPASPTPGAPDELTTLRQRLETLERERNTAAEQSRAAELQNLNRQQQQDYMDLDADVKAAIKKAQKDEQRLNNLATEYQSAQADRDVETMEAISLAYQEQAEDLAVSQRAAVRLQQQQTQFKAYTDNQYHEAKMREQANQIGAIAAKYGLTPDDVKAVNPKLDITNPFQVQETMLAALHKKLTAEISSKDKEVKEQGTKIRQEILTEFDNSPGAQPHPGGSTNTATGAPLGIRVGNSGALLERAFKNQR